MVRTSRGIAGEKAAILEEQREAARELEEMEIRRTPSLAEVRTSLKTDKVIWSPESFKFKYHTPKFDQDEGRKGDALPFKNEKCLDMAPIKKGSLFFMSKNYVEENKDRYDEELDRATF
ncbi:hypothetical protein F5Y13DRAFT_205336 [Hypoxylon sp. FL1857]|nr:hypothetical protein F5Y13DRAFT_205336 [Hypoxylon sp. FL1857]